MGGVAASDSQNHATYSGSISKGASLQVLKSGNSEEILSLETPKEANYIYFSFPSAFTAKLNNVQIATSGSSSSDDDDENITPINNQSYLKLSTIISILSIMLI